MSLILVVLVLVLIKEGSNTAMATAARPQTASPRKVEMFFVLVCDMLVFFIHESLGNL